MRRERRFGTIAQVCAAILVSLASLWMGAQPQASALGYGYGGGGTGTSTLSFDPQSLAVQQGGSASARVTVKLASGKSWGTNLQATGVPAGVTVTFDPASGDPPFTSTMTVKATSGATPGAYSVKVQATGDDPSAAVQYKVSVARGSSGY